MTGSRIISFEEENAINFVRYHSDELQMPADVIYKRMKVMTGDSNKNKQSATDILYRLSNGLPGNMPLFRNAYARGRASAVLENAGVANLFILVQLFRTFVFQQCNRDVAVDNLDVCETARPDIWDAAARLFTPSLTYHHIIALASDGSMECKAKRAERLQWPPVYPSGAAVPRLYLTHEPPPSGASPENQLLYWCGSPGRFDVNYLAFTIRDEKELTAPANCPLANARTFPAGVEGRYGGNVKTPVWVMFFGQCVGWNVLEEVQRSRAINDYFRVFSEFLGKTFPTETIDM